VIRVVHIITSLISGGAERFLVDLCKSSTSDDIEHHVISLHDEGDLGPELVEIGIPLTSLRLSKSPSALISANRKVEKYISEFNIDVVHAHLFHALLCVISSRWQHRSVQIFFSSHSPEVGGTMREVTLSFLKRYRDIDIILTEDQKRHYHKRTHIVIHNTVDYEAIHDISSKQRKVADFTFIHVGRLSLEKNQAALIAQFAKAHKVLPQTRLWIVGDGPQRSTLISLIDELGLQSVVTLYGRRSDVYELLGQAHAFVLSSHYEGAPLSVLEAAAAKLPIISTAVGIVPHILSEDRGEILENIDGMKESMVAVANHYADYMLRAQKLYSYLTSVMSYEAMLFQYENAYRQAVAASRSSQSKEGK